MVFGFGKKKEEKLLLEPIPSEPPRMTPPPAAPTDTESIRAKMDVLSTQIDSLKAQTSAIAERLDNIERMVREIYQIAKS